MGRLGARIGAGVAVGLLGAGAVWAWSAGRGRGARDFPDGIRMLCVDPGCGRAFDTTLAEIARVRAEDDEAPVPCPDCAGPTVRGVVCPSCEGTYRYGGAVRDRGDEPACPLCKETLPRLTPGG
ncbi:MAG: hypothetical protein IT431_07355 [Phycisphaerales bacterium]|nr:hypothetical protein [Phycisphaerales bacterium]